MIDKKSNFGCSFVILDRQIGGVMSLLDNMEVAENEIDKLLIIDLHNMIFRNIFIAYNLDPLMNEKFNLWKHLMLSSLYGCVKQFEPTRMVIAQEGRKYWRRDIYSDYKGNRAAARQDSVVDFEKFFPVMEEFINELKTIIPNALFIKVDRAEADDVIAVLSKNFATKETTIVSNDKDMYQLQKYPWIKQWNPIKKSYMKILSPETDLKIKIILGDPGDNIPSIGKRIGKKIGPVGAAKMLKNFDEELANPKVFEAYTLNRTLIDFSCIPKEVETAILEEYNNYTVGKYNGRNMYQYLVERDMSKNLENLQDFNRVFGEIS